MKNLILIILFIFNLRPLFSGQNIYPLDSEYTKWAELLPKIKILKKQYPDLVKWEILGKTATNHFPIYAINISDFSTKNGKPKIIIIGQHHSEEPVGIEIAYSLAETLCKRYNLQENITNLVNEFSWWIIPTINPEGMYYFQNGDYDHKRKNNSDTNKNGKFDLKYDGVDLNRNYDFNWNNNDHFSPESRYFPGFSSKSEKEIQIISKFMKEKSFQLAYFYHSSYSGNFSEMIFFPWKRDNVISYDYHKMLDLAKIMQQKLPKDYEKSYYKIYSQDFAKRSLARDFIYANCGTLAFNIETCGIKNGIPIVFPNNKKMKKIVRKNINAIFASAESYYENLTKITVVDLKNRPLINEPYIFQNQKTKYPLHKTNDFGSIYIYKNREKFVKFRDISYSINDTIHTFIKK